MTLKEYMAQLEALVKENPEALNLKVVYSRDDEGNGFDPVIFNPSTGLYDGQSRGQYIPTQNLEDNQKPNAVCLN